METTKRLYQAVQEIWEGYYRHPFVQGIQNGTLDRNKFRYYILQDYLYLGSEARINTPSTLGDNWKWRVRSNVFTKQLSAKLLEYAGIYVRLPH